MTSNEYKVTLWNEFLETDTVLSEQDKGSNKRLY